MQVCHGVAQVPADVGATVAAIGNFDGVHCGHRAILADVRAQAAQLGARSAVVTFDPHPLQLLRPEDTPALLTPLPQKLALLAETGIDFTLVLPFTRDFSEQSPRAFASDVLRDALHAVAVHEGDTFRFGYQASAGMEQLRALGAELGFAVWPHALLRRRGLAVSSSQVRALVAEGRVEQARALLGGPFSVVSTQARGRGIGTKLLVPTINLAPVTQLVPAPGVYVTRVELGSGSAATTFAAVTNAGHRPTFGADAYTIESYLLDFAPVECGSATEITVSFLHRLREEQRFDSPQALKRQIDQDVLRARRYHALAARVRGAEAVDAQ